MARSPLKLIAGLAGLTAVILGAAGAHAWKETLAQAGMTAVWTTAVQYHLAHAVALLLAAEKAPQNVYWRRAGVAWSIGILLFSGSLYMLALGGPKWLGPVTPLGGVAFLLGWIFILIDGWRPKS